MMKTLEKFKNNVFKECILTVLEIIWNCREIIFLNVVKACTLVVFKKILNCSQKIIIMKTRMVK